MVIGRITDRMGFNLISLFNGQLKKRPIKRTKKRKCEQTFSRHKRGAAFSKRLARSSTHSRSLALGLIHIARLGFAFNSKPNGYVVLCRSFLIGLDPDLNPYSDGFPNGYCTYFRDRSLSQGQMSIPILLYFNQGIRVRI